MSKIKKQKVLKNQKNQKVKNKDYKGVKEYTCGWCKKFKIDSIDINLPIYVGTPFDQPSKTEGLASLKIVDIKEETKIHTTMMPDIFVSTETLLPFINSYRHYIDLKNVNPSIPLGHSDIEIIECFSKIINCPDILEEVAETFENGFWVKQSDDKKKQLTYIGECSVEIVERLKTIFLVKDFQWRRKTITDSSCGDPEFAKRRKEIIQAALRFEQSKEIIESRIVPEDSSVEQPVSILKVLPELAKEREETFLYFEDLGLQDQMEEKTGEQFEKFEAIEVVQDENEDDDVDQFLQSSRNRRGSTFKVKYRVTITEGNYPAFYRRATVLKPKNGQKAEILAIEEFGEDEENDEENEDQ